MARAPGHRWWDTRWKRIRQVELERVSNRCEACGAEGVLLVHEKWRYDDAKNIQSLAGFEVVCQTCSLAHHLGFANVRGFMGEAKARLALVNHLSPTAVDELVSKAFDQWEKRSDHQWSQNLSWLVDHAATYSLTQDDAQRAAVEVGQLTVESRTRRERATRNSQPPSEPSPKRGRRQHSIEDFF